MIVNEISLVIQNIKIEFQLYVYKRIFLLNSRSFLSLVKNCDWRKDDYRSNGYKKLFIEEKSRQKKERKCLDNSWPMTCIVKKEKTCKPMVDCRLTIEKMKEKLKINHPAKIQRRLKIDFWCTFLHFQSYYEWFIRNLSKL